MTARPLAPRVLLAVAVGGALGAVARHLLAESFPVAGAEFPWTTLGINVAGSVLLALLAAPSVVRRHRLLPAFLGTGVLGGFTTLSTFSDEARAMVAAGSVGLAAIYMVGSVATCLVGVALADRFSGPAARDQFENEEGDR